MGYQVVSDVDTAFSGIVVVCQLAAGLWIWSVWTWRYGADTGFRGGDAKNLADEFKVYGYPHSVFLMVGAIKLLCATCILQSVIVPFGSLVLLSSGGLLVLMLVAVYSHWKVGDPWERSIPAGCMVFCSGVSFLAQVAGVNLLVPATDLSFPAVLATPEVRMVLGVLAIFRVVTWVYKECNKGTYSELFSKKDDKEAPLLANGSV